MDEHIEDRLDELDARVSENQKLIQDNHNILKKLHRALVFRRVLTVVYWVVIIGVAIGAFYFLQPFVERFSGTYSDVHNILNATSGPASFFFGN